MSKVLIVDDEASLRITLGEFLKREGYEVNTAENVKSAILLLQENEYDAVLSDIVMPEQSGVSLLKYIQETKPDTQVIMMTGQPTVDTAVEAIRFGARDYLFKPVLRNDLIRVVNQAVTFKQLLDEKQKLEIERDMLRISIERAEQNLKNFFNTINDLLFVLDMEGNIIHTNKTVIKRLGFSMEELIGQSILCVHPEKRRAEAGRITQEMLEGKTEFCPVPVVTKQGVEIPVETRVFFGEWDGKPALFGVTKDITDLKKSEEKFAKAFNSQSVLMAISTVEDGIYLDVNDTFLTTLGYTRDEVIGKNSEELNIFADQDMRERVKNNFLAGRIGQNEEIEIVGKDKTVFTGIFNVELISVDDTPCLLTNMVNITARKMVEDERLHRVMGSVIDVLVSTVESRDPYTSGHQKRVSDLSRAVAAEMGMSPSRVEEIRIAGEVHDLGKVSIPADILSMPRKLKKQEFDLIMTHSRNGYEILKDVNFDWPIAEIVYQHHERMDGSGYPRGLKGDEICMDARIICVADVVEAMSSHRPYRPALGIEPALSEISQGRGTRYDSHVVDACIRVFREHHYQFVSE